MKMLFLGDIAATENSAEFFRTKNMEQLFSDTIDIFKDRDFTFVNVECALTNRETPIVKIGSTLKTPPEAAEVLRDIGVTLCGLSNNHSLDYGRLGAMDTMAALKKVGIDYTGFGDNYEDSRKNYYWEKNGEKFAIIAVSEHEYCYALDDRMGGRPFDEIHTLEDIRAAKAEGARVIVIYHGGKEFCHYPSPRHRKVCQGMVRAGAELILCQHSHCVGSFEEYEGATIVYGQGNFHFIRHTSSYCPDMDMWTRELAIEYDTDTKKVTYIPIRATNPGGIRLAPDGDEIMRAFYEHSEILKDKEAWLREWRSFCYGYARPEVYKEAILHALSWKEVKPLAYDNTFAHYLDCEAHTDVWREMFPTLNQTNERD